MNRELILVVLLGVAVLSSALGVVRGQHLTRQLFVEIQKQRATIDELNIDWGRLQLEQSTWGTHLRIETLARAKLSMHAPSFQELGVLRR